MSRFVIRIPPRFRGKQTDAANSPMSKLGGHYRINVNSVVVGGSANFSRSEIGRVINVNQLVNSTVAIFSRCRGKRKDAAEIRGPIRIIRDGQVAIIRRIIFRKFCKDSSLGSPRDAAASRQARHADGQVASLIVHWR